MKMNRMIGLALVAGLALGAVAGFAVAQTTTLPGVTNVGQTDAFLDVVGGQPTAQGKYALAPQIVANQAYHNLGTVTTDPGYAVTGAIVNVFGHASGTVTAVTLTLPPSPADGRRVCYWLDQTTTTLTWTANTGQAIDSNVHAAGVQYISNCVTYLQSTATWISAN